MSAPEPTPTDLRAATGARYLELMARRLAQTVDVDGALVAGLDAAESDRATVLAGCVDGAPTPTIAYSPSRAPCGQVLAHGFSVIPHGAAARYPGLAPLRAAAVDTYMGIRLHDAGRVPIGILALLSWRPIADAAAAKAALVAVAVRAGAELERIRADERRRVRRDGLIRRLIEGQRELQRANRRLRSDLDERVQDGETLRRSEEKLRAIIHSASDIITILAADGTIRYHSPAIARTLQWDEHELVGRSAYDLIHPDDHAAVSERLAGAGAGGDTRSRPLEYRFRHRDGSWVVLEAVGRNQLDDPAVAGIVVSSRDVTERRRLEAQLVHGQRMESIGRLAGGVAHDFNNLLTSILAHTGFLEEALAPGSVEREDARHIRDAADRAARLTKQLLAFARRQVVDRYPLDANACIGDLERMLRRLIGEHVLLRVQLAPELPAVLGDAAQVEQVLVNLALNARDAMPGGGALVIETSFISAAATGRAGGVPPGAWVRIAVSDTGSGIPDEALPHVFEPFFTTKGPGGGTGLGLATCYGIVTQMGGIIVVRSVRGVGTRFEILLPSITDAAAPAGPKEEPVPPRGNETLLLVEDDPSTRLVTRRTLERLGYSVHEAVDGVDALRHFAHTDAEFDLVLTDLVMPQLGGAGLYRAVRAGGSMVPFLFISGYPGTVDADANSFPEGVPFVYKPWSPHRLAAAVRAELDRPIGTETPTQLRVRPEARRFLES